jgi:hypothetical protein
MKVIGWIIFFVMLVLWAKSNFPLGGMPAPPGLPWVNVAVQALGIVGKVVAIQEAEASVTVQRKDGATEQLQVRQLAERNGLLDGQGNIDQAQIYAFDDRIQQALVRCSLPHPGVKTYKGMVNARVDCMAASGYNANDQVYIRAKQDA